jgi:hypothetical protein
MKIMIYQKLDAALIESVKSGANTFAKLRVECSREACSVPVEIRDGGYRMIDQRLQALRKKGKVAFNSKTGWVIKNDT